MVVNTTQKIVVAGAGQAAIAFAAKMRALDNETDITLIGEEPSLPYQRPPLSKKYMTGKMDIDRLLLRPADWYRENNINCITKTTITGIDTANKSVILADTAIPFDKLLIATGARPRALPDAVGGALKGVCLLRDLKDADCIRSEMSPDKSVLIIGGGYIGLEAAAVCATQGMKVRVIEMAERILQRVASEQTSDFVRAKHRSHRVEISENLGLERLSGENGRVTKALLNDGTEQKVDFVIVGIGVLPNMELAQQAGIACNNGIIVDQHTQTSCPDIFAAGDVANFEFRGKQIRLESVQNAIDQAEHAAKVIAGSNDPYVPLPWFWSDQFDMKLQIAGLSQGYDQTVVRPGTHDGGQSVWYFENGNFIAVDAINDAKAYMSGKKILELGKTITPDQATDAGFNLTNMITRKRN